jgi:hypothetical protein
MGSDLRDCGHRFSDIPDLWLRPGPAAGEPGWFAQHLQGNWKMTPPSSRSGGSGKLRRPPHLGHSQAPNVAAGITTNPAAGHAADSCGAVKKASVTLDKHAARA